MLRPVTERGLTIAAPDGVRGDYVFTQAELAAGELGVRPQIGLCIWNAVARNVAQRGG